MSIYLGNTLLTGSGGGGGGGTSIGTTTVTSPAGVSYTVYDSTDITKTFEAAFSNNAVNTSTSAGDSGYTIDLENKGSTSTGVTYFKPSLPINEMSGSTNNNVFTTFFNDTAGGGVFYWAYIRAFYYLTITSASSGSRSGSQTATMRITIDGGTPVEFNCGASSITSSGGVTANFQMNSTGVLGFGNFLEYQDTQYTAFSQYGRYPLISSITPTTTGTFTESFKITSGLTKSNLGTSLEFIGQNPEQLRRQGIPGINYQTSLKIEMRYNAIRSGAWNGRWGTYEYGSSVVQF